MHRLATASLMIAVSLVGSHAIAGAPSTVADAPYPAEFRTKVRKAIQKGVEYLQVLAVEALSGGGSTAMDERVDFEIAATATWALRRAGITDDTPLLVRAAKILDARTPKGPWEAALVLLAVCTVPLPGADPFAIEEPPATGQTGPKLDGGDLRIAERAVKVLLDLQLTKPGLGAEPGDESDGTGGWGPYIESMKRQVDSAFLGETQFALAGLEAASRRGIEIPPKALLSAIRLLLRRQQTKGPTVTLKLNQVRSSERLEWTESAQARGFDNLEPTERSNGFDTAASAVSLMICQDALQKDEEFTPELRLAARNAVRDALAWVQQNYTISKNPVVGKVGDPDDGADTLNDWTQLMMRLGIHARTRFYGSHDWYLDGAKKLMKSQTAEGAIGKDSAEHCAALLFLMKTSAASLAPLKQEDSAAGR